MIFKIIFLNQPEGRSKDARVHCVVLKVRAVPSPQPATAGNKKGPEKSGSHPVPQDPTACMCRTNPPQRSKPEGRTNQRINPRHQVKCSTHELTSRTHSVLIWRLEDRSLQMLLRKEVIQPHLPVRLPCYDLVLITDPTFDGSLHKGWATGFRCYRLS